MYIVGVIPARYESIRFPGKPLADICGKPMIWWVYEQAKKVKELDELYVATDDERIKKVCEKYNIKTVITSPMHRTPMDRLQEVSNFIKADLYVYVSGDEPILPSEIINKVIPDKKDFHDEYIANLISKTKNLTEAKDPTNLKIVTDDQNYGIYMSRSLIPYSKTGIDFYCRKYVGVGAFTKKMLDFYVNSPRHRAEIMEDTDLLRYIMNQKKVKFIEVESNSLSVDTPKDLEVVKKVIQQKIDNGELKL